MTPEFRQITPEEIQFCEVLKTILVEIGTADKIDDREYTYEDDLIRLYWRPGSWQKSGSRGPSIFEVCIPDPSSPHLKHIRIVLRLSLNVDNTGRVEFHRPGRWVEYVKKVVLGRANQAIQLRQQEEARKEAEERRKWEAEHYGPIDDDGVFFKYREYSNEEFLKALEELP